jgi:hypothetical protein
VTNIVEPQWGIEFEPEDLEAAFALAEDIGLPLSVGLDHEGCPEVLEVPHRAQRLRERGEILFMIYRSIGGGFTALELGAANTRTITFSDLAAALRFCREQRGADWPG